MTFVATAKEEATKDKSDKGSRRHEEGERKGNGKRQREEMISTTPNMFPCHMARLLAGHTVAFRSNHWHFECEHIDAAVTYFLPDRTGPVPER